MRKTRDSARAVEATINDYVMNTANRSQDAAMEMQ